MDKLLLKILLLFQQLVNFLLLLILKFNVPNA